MTTKRTHHIRLGGPDCTCLGSERERRGEMSTRMDAHYDDCPRAAWNNAGRPTKRTHGPCSEECMAWRTTHRLAVNNHLPDCPSLYPAQQEPDALTRLVRECRALELVIGAKAVDHLLSLISKAREEQRKARDRGWNDGLEEAARWLEVVLDQPTMATEVRAKKVTP